ncbi:MAG: hypothetical protein ACR2LL_00070 [Nitrosopumilus sp.]
MKTIRLQHRTYLGKDRKTKYVQHRTNIPDYIIKRLGAQRIEIHDTDGSLIKTYDLIEKYLSLLDNQYTGCSEIVVDLYVKI